MPFQVAQGKLQLQQRNRQKEFRCDFGWKMDQCRLFDVFFVAVGPRGHKWNTYDLWKCPTATQNTDVQFSILTTLANGPIMFLILDFLQSFSVADAFSVVNNWTIKLLLAHLLYCNDFSNCSIEVRHQLG